MELVTQIKDWFLGREGKASHGWPRKLSQASESDCQNSKKMGRADDSVLGRECIAKHALEISCQDSIKSP